MSVRDIKEAAERVRAVRREWLHGEADAATITEATDALLRIALALPGDAVLVSRATLQRWIDGCWCDDRDGNCNPPRNENCDRCREIASLLAPT